MMTYPFYLVNVFAKSHFGGNPLCVFPKADGLTDEHMQAIAKQFNLSETVFIRSPSDNKAVADLRIFTPDYELPLAGHPTLGSAFVIHELLQLGSQFVLNTCAKAVNIAINDNQVKLNITGFNHKTSLATKDELAAAIGLNTSDIDNHAFWINSGSPQLLLKVLNKDSLYHAKINKELLQAICQKDNEREMICLWYDDGDIVFVRFFFVQNGAVLQDSGTGSACANLGAYFISQNHYPITKTIHQGDDMGRPNRLSLEVDENQNIFVGGNVIAVGRGEFYVP